ncbi:MAG: NAD(P)/FAD-dependent oxidoreductase [Hellea sp.]
MATQISADYLIIGTGAMGMAFADTLLTESGATIIMVDRFAKPGGHWNVAYPFVTLHQPSTFYGVSSRELSQGLKDQVGLNKGLNDLASGQDVLRYYDDVMRHQFLPSGRLEYFPMCNYEGDGKFNNKLSGEGFEVTYKKLVDCTYLKTTVPSTHTPNFEIADGVTFMPLNDLPKLTQPADMFNVIGGGKTGIDALLWLLEMGVHPHKIQWVVSRDAWLLDRENTQPTAEFFGSTMGAQAAQFESIANATSVEDMFDRLEESGYFVRIDKNTRPQMFHGATISQAELTALRQLKNVVRLGRVTKIDPNLMTLEQGTAPTTPGTVHIDCSASALKADLPPTLIFTDNVITPQMVRSYQPIFSASLIAHIEATYPDDNGAKNNMCGVVPLPNADIDYMRMTAAFMMNQYKWSQDPEIRNWLLTNRLDGFSKMVSEVGEDETEKLAILKRLRKNAMPAMAKLQQFLAEV